MHKRTKACAISRKTKDVVYKRDMGACIFCGAPGLPEAHVIARSHGGLGCAENIITACRSCHDKMDNSEHRQQMIEHAISYLKMFYPEWNSENFTYDKWHKDKGCDTVQNGKIRNRGDSDGMTEDKTLEDNGEPPEGFYFLGENDGDVHEI